MIVFPRWIRVTVALMVLLILWSITRPIIDRSPLNGQRMKCQSNLKQIALACREYMQDYDDRFPPVSTPSGQGWTELILPYTKTQDLFHCPSNPDAIQSSRTDYFYNARLSKTWMISLEMTGQTIIFGDSYMNGSSNSHLTKLPSAWKSNGNSPGRRHLDGANYAFADGHVKWLQPERISSLKPSNTDAVTAIFALR